jgi:3-hydroxyisobutyrate dehydrogenase-like beta-hydroxyacid dehydrogenase
MGLAMAKNVQRALSTQEKQASLNYYNRTASKGAPLAEMGGIPCQSIAELSKNCDLIFISVREDHRSRTCL